jgi:hypothetical protein
MPCHPARAPQQATACLETGRCLASLASSDGWLAWRQVEGIHEGALHCLQCTAAVTATRNKFGLCRCRSQPATEPALRSGKINQGSSHTLGRGCRRASLGGWLGSGGLSLMSVCAHCSKTVRQHRCHIQVRPRLRKVHRVETACKRSARTSVVVCHARCRKRSQHNAAA